MIDLAMVSPYLTKANNNLVSWKVASTSETKISIDLQFNRPLQVSKGDSADELFC